MSVAVAEEVAPAVCPRVRVHKFGGSSLANAAAVRQAATIVAGEAGTSCWVVVSAAQGITDALLECLQVAASGEDWRHALRRLHRRQGVLLSTLLDDATARPLRKALAADMRRLKTLLSATTVLRAASAETSDAVLAHGELWSMRVFAAMLRERGLNAASLDARDFLALRRGDGLLSVDWLVSTRLFDKARAALEADVVVVPGFIGRCAERGITLTLGRNGSDWSATILARLAEADTVTIWSDVAGVLDADPAVVDEAKTQAELDFDTAHTLACHGARILHPATLAPLAGRDVSVYVKNTFASQQAGTRLDRRLGAPEAMVSAHDDTVSVIGRDVRGTLALEALAHAHIEFKNVEMTDGRLGVQVVREDVARSQRIWHRRLCRRRRRVDVVLIGVGHVGGAFLKALCERGDEAIRLMGVADSKHFVVAQTGHGACGVPPKRVKRLLHDSKSASNPEAFTEFLVSHCEAAPVIVDATGSEDIAALHADWLATGVHVVTANKIAAANGWVGPAHRESAFYGDAATVGAGLPVLPALRRMRAAGDEIVSIEGLLSGSLAYLFHALERGRGLGAALASASRAGYIEPDPRADLSGMDVARKLAIVAEAAGIESDIAPPEPAVPATLLEEDEAVFQRCLPELEQALRRRVEAARVERQVLRYVGSLTADGTNHIGPCGVARAAALARTRGVDNVVVIRSRAYSGEPLVIRGSGAGPLVTARAMLADLAEAVNRFG